MIAGGDRSAAAPLLAIVADRLVGEPPACSIRSPPSDGLMAALEPPLYRNDRAGRGGVRRDRSSVWRPAPASRLRRAGVLAATLVAAELAVAGRMLAAAAGDVRAPSMAGDLDGARRLLPSLVGRDPTAARRSRDRPGGDRVGGREHRRRRGGAGAVGGRARRARCARLPGRQHARRHGRPPLPAVRAVRMGLGPPRRRRRHGCRRGSPRSSSPPSGRPPLGPCGAPCAPDAPAHPSPNAGVAEAAFAAALGVRLGGINRYGDRVEHRGAARRGRTPVPTDIAPPSRWPATSARRWPPALAPSAIGSGVASRRRHRR